jgi:cytochrome b561
MLRNRLSLWLDTLLFLAVCVLMVTDFTGIPIHEWLGIALVPALLFHLLLQWPWIATRTRRLPEPRTGRTRVNYGINLVLFLSMVATIQSGLAISRVAMRSVFPGWLGNRRWGQVHGWASSVLLLMVGLHVALNWDWVLAVARKRLRFVTGTNS